MQQPSCQIYLAHQEPLGNLLVSVHGVGLEGGGQEVMEGRRKLTMEERQQVEHYHDPFVAMVRSRSTRGIGHI